METTKTINPATGEKIAEYDRISTSEAKDKVAKAHEVYLSWRQKTFEERAKLMHKLADVLEENKEEYWNILNGQTLRWERTKIVARKDQKTRQKPQKR